MGCLKLSYRQAEEGIGKTAFFSGGRLEKKESALKNRIDYYPFGLTFNSYQRSYSKANNFKFNGIERDPVLDLDMAFYRSYDPALGRWWQIDPLASERESPYVGMGNNPIYYSDPLGDTVRVSGLDVYTLVNLVWSLSDITGNNIGFNNGVLVNNGKKDKDKPGNEAGAYLDNLISSDGVITVKSISGEEKSNAEGEIIELNTGHINDNLNSVGETYDFGMTFFHESLHTWTGTFAWAGLNTDRTDTYGDPVTDPNHPNYNPNATGETVDIVNRFRSQANLSRRDSYFETDHSNSSGNYTHTTLPFGGKNVNRSPMTNTDYQNRRTRASIYYMNMQVKRLLK